MHFLRNHSWRGWPTLVLNATFIMLKLKKKMYIFQKVLRTLYYINLHIIDFKDNNKPFTVILVNSKFKK